MKKSTHYVDNEKFLDALIQHKKACNDAVARGEEKPILPNYIGECFIKISNHLAYKGNFINYSFRDDMISDAIENCLVAAEKFDPEKSKNPFAYYTQIVYFAFIRRIQKEKKQQATKYKLLENINIEEIITQEGDSEVLGTQFLDYIRKQLDQIDPDRRAVTISQKSSKLAEEITAKLDLDD
jgi:DNA-directed RNA polymerase specialized sigma24 family protein